MMACACGCGVGAVAGVLREERSHETAGVDLVHAVLAAACDRAVNLKPVEGGGDGGVIGGQHFSKDPRVL